MKKICDVYCFQLREVQNDNLLGTKIDFEFLSENLLCSINEFGQWSKILSYIYSAQTFPDLQNNRNKSDQEFVI